MLRRSLILALLLAPLVVLASEALTVGEKLCVQLTDVVKLEFCETLVPPEFAQPVPEIKSEPELLTILHEEGYELGTVMHASRAEWDRYESDNWLGLLQWLREYPEHPDRQQVIDHLHDTQEDYLRYGRHYIGWALYVLFPGP